MNAGPWAIRAGRRDDADDPGRAIQQRPAAGAHALARCREQQGRARFRIGIDPLHLGRRRAELAHSPKALADRPVRQRRERLGRPGDFDRARSAAGSVATIDISRRVPSASVMPSGVPAVTTWLQVASRLPAIKNADPSLFFIVSKLRQTTVATAGGVGGGAGVGAGAGGATRALHPASSSRARIVRLGVGIAGLYREGTSHLAGTASDASALGTVKEVGVGAGE